MVMYSESISGKWQCTGCAFFVIKRAQVVLGFLKVVHKSCVFSLENGTSLAFIVSVLSTDQHGPCVFPLVKSTGRALIISFVTATIYFQQSFSFNEELLSVLI